jgi:hypothetical protein
MGVVRSVCALSLNRNSRCQRPIEIWFWEGREYDSTHVQRDDMMVVTGKARQR